MYVAQKEGLFEKHNLKVELIPVASAPERDQVFAAAQVDGMINEALVTALINKDQVHAQVVRYARTATRQDALFSIVASGKSGITGVDGLKGVEIGVSQATIIEYLTERLLQAQGFKPEEIKTINVPKIPDRINLLGTGELKAATLPEPPVTLALLQGGKLVLDDRALPELSFSTITFRKEFIDQHAESLRGFLAAIEAGGGIDQRRSVQVWRPAGGAESRPAAAGRQIQSAAFCDRRGAERSAMERYARLGQREETARPGCLLQRFGERRLPALTPIRRFKAPV